MTNIIIILIYIAAVVTINVIVKYFIYVESVNRRKEYVESINRLCNLIAERIDNGKKDN